MVPPPNDSGLNLADFNYKRSEIYVTLCLF